MILLVGGEKGGTGKTTLAVNLASLRSAQGRDVLIVDTDPQGSASYWTQIRDEAEILPRVASIQKFGKGLQTELRDLSSRYQDIIIDAGGRDSVELRVALIACDMAIIPVQASQFDLWTLDRANGLVEQARGFNENLKSLVVISRAPTHINVSDAADAAELVKDYDCLALAKSEIRDRIAYRRAAGQGKGVTEYGGDEKAIFEIKSLYREIFNEQI